MFTSQHPYLLQLPVWETKTRNQLILGYKDTSVMLADDVFFVERSKSGYDIKIDKSVISSLDKKVLTIDLILVNTKIHAVAVNTFASGVPYNAGYIYTVNKDSLLNFRNGVIYLVKVK